MINWVKDNIVSIIIVLVVVLGVVKIFVDDYSLSRNHKFTIGTISNIRASRQGQALEFIYDVDRNIYTGSVPGDKFANTLIGLRFYVKFEPSRPSNAFILLTKAVPDSIQSPPSSGWDKLPHYEVFYLKNK